MHRMMKYLMALCALIWLGTDALAQDEQRTFSAPAGGGWMGTGDLRHISTIAEMAVSPALSSDSTGMWSGTAGFLFSYISMNPLELVAARTLDSMVLVSIFQSTGGANWEGSYNWTSGSMLDAWTGVTVTDDRVTGLDLSSSNLTGVLPDISSLDMLSSLDLSSNELTSVGSLYLLTNLTSLNISDNHLAFDELEPNVGISGITYAPQKEIGVDTVLYTPVYSDYTVGISMGGSANIYSWTLTNDVVENSVVQSGTSSNSYLISAITYENMGEYVVTATNTLVPGLTLTYATQTVYATADLAVTAYGSNSSVFSAGVGYAFEVKEVGAYDTIQVVSPSGGLYYFDDMKLGDYLIVIKPNAITDYLMTYYPSTDLWTEATQLQFRDDVAEEITMVGVPPELTVDPDLGIVKGLVESDFPDEESSSGRVLSRKKVQRAACSMRKFQRTGRSEEDGTWTLYAYVESDDEGNFRFENIEAGSYRFNIEYPGVPMDTTSFVEFEVGADGVEKNTFTLEAVITDDGIVVSKIEELGFYRKYFKDLVLYPNPANEVLNIGYSKLMSESLVLKLMDLQGRTILEQKITEGYDQVIAIDVTRVKAGIYMACFVDTQQGGKTVSAQRVIITK